MKKEDRKMGVSYNKLFKKMIDLKMSTSDLREKAGISANIISHLKNDEYISMSSLEKICMVMKCGVDEILEFDNNER